MKTYEHVNDQASAIPWYSVKMVWLILAIPACTVAGCLFTIYLALANPDYLVKSPQSDSQGPVIEP